MEPENDHESNLRKEEEIRHVPATGPELCIRKLLAVLHDPAKEDVRTMIEKVCRCEDPEGGTVTYNTGRLDAVRRYVCALERDLQMIATNEIEQSSRTWRELRARRITSTAASNILGTNPHSKLKGDLPKIAQSIVHRDLDEEDQLSRKSPLMRYGIVHEKDGLHLYECYKYLQLLTTSSLSPQASDLEEPGRGFWIEKVGIKIHPRFPWLSASPDFVAHFRDTTSWLGEIKCPFPADRVFGGARNEDKKKSIIYDEIPHYYYDQIQLAMAVFGFDYCDFVVWTEEQTKIERYLFDREYFSKFMFPALQHFFLCHFVPEFVAAAAAEENRQ